MTINMDETPVAAHIACHGYMVTKKTTAVIDRFSETSCPVSLAKRRSYMSHMAFISDCPEYQALLPQVPLVNEKLLAAASVPELKSKCPTNVYLLRQRSSWASGDLLVELIACLAFTFAPYRESLDIVLVVDSCRCHLSRKVFAATRFHGIRLTTIASNLTWRLQP